MAYNIKDGELDQKLTELARAKRTSKVDALRDALDHELEREAAKLSAWELSAPARQLIEKARTNREPIDWDALKRASDADWRF
jgi:hypothetical protein